MAIKTTSPEIRRVVEAALARGTWVLEAGGKHVKLRYHTGRMVIFAVSASDVRAHKNLLRDIRHVELGIPGRGEPNVCAVANMPKQGDNSLTDKHNRSAK